MISNPSHRQWKVHPDSSMAPCGRVSSLKKNEKRVHLGSTYIPAHNAVICGRGKACTSSPGNKKLRAYINSFAASYGAASNKEQKSKIVSTIISLIEGAEGGAFVKYEESTWWKVDEAYAREKIGNIFRDVLHTKYRSSAKAKQERKQMATNGTLRFNNEIRCIAHKLSMDQSYSSSCSSSASTTTTCPYSNNNRSNVLQGDLACNNAGFRPSLVGFPTMSLMMGLGKGNFYNTAIPSMPRLPFERRNILFNYFNEALKITSHTDVGMNIVDTGVVPSTVSLQKASAIVRNGGGILMECSTASSSKISTEGGRMERDDKDHDETTSNLTVAGNNEITVSDFLVENVEVLSRIFLDDE
ncbi:hypothetical protein IV203_006428 [Nitzschia inconspicua]|uniref:DUF6824 domain-containing protein n=1 Tax=Nitzschia inconspicua TaxID=303405 RepID=A0A9K3KA35_9STRA|nr:hypothetical protein IV203_006428 [Nitzschia inconspicua]